MVVPVSLSKKRQQEIEVDVFFCIACCYINFNFVYFCYFSVVTCLEALICIKYGLDMFKKTEIAMITLWLLFQVQKILKNPLSYNSVLLIIIIVITK